MLNTNNINENYGYNIVFPLVIPWNQCADFQKQTIEFIKKKNNCFVYLGADKKKFINLKRTHNLCLFYPMNNITKVKFLDNFFHLINHFIFKLIVKFLLKKDNSIDIVWLFNSELNSFFKLFKKNLKIKIYDSVDFADFNNIFTTVKEANLIFANSTILYRFISSISNKKVVLVPQGFDLLSFKNNKKLKTIKPLKKLTISYIGSINFRFDFLLIHNLIKANPEHNFVFWGPVQYLNDKLDELFSLKDNVNQLKKYKNVKFGQSDRNGIIKLLENTSIGIIPYNTLLDFNRNCFPMKLFEYFYMGIPVVSTEIEELHRFKKITKISNDHKEWTKFINQIKTTGWPSEKRAIARKLAEDNSWQEKIKKIQQEISNYQPKKI